MHKGLKFLFSLSLCFTIITGCATSDPAVKMSQYTASATKLIGTWKLQTFAFVPTATGMPVNAWGEHPDGYLSYSPDGRMSAIVVSDNRKKPGSPPTDEEMSGLFQSVSSYAGSYTLEGADKVAHHIDISWNQAWTGTDQVRYYALEGNILTIATATAKWPVPGHRMEEGKIVLTWMKVE